MRFSSVIAGSLAPMAMVVMALGAEPQVGSTPAKVPASMPSTRASVERIRIPDHVVEFSIVRVPGGTLTVQDSKNKEISIELKPFWIGQYEVTWPEYEIYFMGLDLKTKEFLAEAGVSRPSRPFENPDRGWGHEGSPAGSITFMQAQLYAKWLAQKTGKKFRLPTSAEWEWACRGGTGAAAVPGAAGAKKVAWHLENSEEQTHPVGKLAPNAWGLYDMLGNVAEWVVMEDRSGAIAGGSYRTDGKELDSRLRETYEPWWQRRDCQWPKSKHWLTDGQHIGIRAVLEDE